MQPTTPTTLANVRQGNKTLDTDDSVRDIIRTHAHQTMRPLALLSAAQPAKPTVPPNIVPVPPNPSPNHDVSVQTPAFMVATPVSHTAIVLRRLKRALEEFDRQNRT